MVTLDMVLFQLTFVLHGLFRKVIGSESLLQNGIAHIFFVPQDSENRAGLPLCFAHAPRNPFIPKSAADNIGVDAVHELRINPADNRRLFLIDDQIAFLVLVVAQKTVRVQMQNTLFEKGPDTPLAVFRNGTALVLCQRRKNGEKQLTRTVHRVDAFFFKLDADAQVFQLSGVV